MYEYLSFFRNGRKLPRAGSLPAAVLAHMLSGQAIDGFKFAAEFDALRLCDSIRALRRAGWVIVGKRVHKPTLRRPGRRVMEYRLGVPADGGLTRRWYDQAG